MPVGLSTTAKNAALDALAALIDQASLHTGDPGAAGTSNEVSGGSPAYSRETISWNAAASGNLDNNANPVFDVPAGTTVSWFGLWDGAVFMGAGQVTSEVFASQGTYTLTDVDLPAT